MEALRLKNESVEQRLKECFSSELHDGLNEELQTEVEQYELSVDVYGPHTVIRHPSLQVLFCIYWWPFIATCRYSGVTTLVEKKG